MLITVPHRFWYISHVPTLPMIYMTTIWNRIQILIFFSFSLICHSSQTRQKSQNIPSLNKQLRALVQWCKVHGEFLWHFITDSHRSKYSTRALSHKGTLETQQHRRMERSSYRLTPLRLYVHRYLVTNPPLTLGIPHTARLQQIPLTHHAPYCTNHDKNGSTTKIVPLNCIHQHV